MSFQIAIDGPVAAGKGTVARLVASKLGFLYVDTGAMYRATALLAKEKGVDWNDEPALANMVAASSMILRNPQNGEKDGRHITVLVDNKDVSWAIRTEEMSRGSSIVSQYKKVREELVRKQQHIAASTDVVMEGRDITYRVLPNAQLKIYLNASQETRAKRRFQELLERGMNTTLKQVYDDLAERDTRDMERKVDPLQIVDGAWVLDTTSLTITEVVELIVSKVQELKGKSSKK